ncbi:metallophosphoesterase family protein [Syntrophorhabdus aromaticivorans]|jgi:exonuclease SbcD|uniref:metallophosphoesterase family protein n=1 Tax=Syntrophorhabdus aromaticivorans TaxID=328301 RepID=UPI00040777D3|nr:metallophosphoesterase [Syntrophorhabdus aromaticivorans]
MDAKILHCADLHFDDEPGRLESTIQCCNKITETAQDNIPNLIAIAGDIYERGLILGSPGSLAAIDFVCRCGDIAPVVIVSGTPTHDTTNSTEVFKRLRTKHPIYSTGIPRQVYLTKKESLRFIELNGDVDKMDEASLLLSCLPSATKASLMAAGTHSMATGAIEYAELLRDLLQAWGVLNEEANNRGIPTMLVGHGTVKGSRLSTGQRATDPDAEFGVADLKLTKAALICLGHVHMPQQVHVNAFYSGSITRTNYGETEDKGFYIHTISGPNVTSRFIETPARTMKTIVPVEGIPDVSLLDGVNPGDYVKIVYSIRQEDASNVDDAALRRLAYEKGATEVKIDKTVLPITNTRSEGISRLKSLTEKLKRWGELNGQPITESLLAKLEMLQTLDEHIILEGCHLQEACDETRLFAA